MAEKVAKKKKYPKMSKGVLHVHTSENNTVITLTDESGNKILGNGTGNVGFKGAKENTPYAAEVLARSLLKIAKDDVGLKECGIIFRGIGMGRDGVFKAINDIGLIDITYIKEATPLQFGGCKGIRPKRM